MSAAGGPPGDARRQRVLATIDSIPAGRVCTYGGVAAEAGLPRNARYVARVLRELPAGHALPWHRVIGAGGALKTAGASQRLQVRLLRAEGVEVTGARVPLARYVWPTPSGLPASPPGRARG